MGILPLFSRLSCPLRPGTKVAVSRDKYNVLLLGLNNGWPLDVPRYTILYYSYSISLLTVYLVPLLPLYPLLLLPPKPLPATPPPLLLLLLLLLVSQLQTSGKPILLPHARQMLWLGTTAGSGRLYKTVWSCILGTSMLTPS